MAKIVLDSEKELEDYLSHIMKSGYSPVTEEHIDKVYRQFDLGGYGVIDLLSVSYVDDGNEVVHEIRVIELKKGPIKSDHIAQIARYKRGIDTFIERSAEDLNGIDISYHLVGDGYAEQGDVQFLADSCEWLSVHHYKFDLEGGVKFEESYGWVRTNATYAGIKELLDWKPDKKDGKVVEFTESLKANEE